MDPMTEDRARASVEIWWSRAYGTFIASCTAYPNVIGTGDNFVAAAKALQHAIDTYIVEGNNAMPMDMEKGRAEVSDQAHGD